MNAKILLVIVLGFMTSGFVQANNWPGPQFHTPYPHHGQPHPFPDPYYPAPTPEPQCNAGGWMQEVPGTFLPQGGDLYAPLRVPAAQCASICLSESQCAGATYHAYTQTCYLKSYNAELRLIGHPEWTSFVKSTQHFQNYANAFLSNGNDLAFYRTGDAATCQSICSCQAACSGYTYHAPSQSCYLKNGSADRQPYPGYGWTSGVKG